MKNASVYREMKDIRIWENEENLDQKRIYLLWASKNFTSEPRLICIPLSSYLFLLVLLFFDVRVLIPYSLASTTNLGNKYFNVKIEIESKIKTVDVAIC